MPKTIEAALSIAKKALMAVSETPDLDARLLLAFVLDVDTSYLYTWPERMLTMKQQGDFEQLVSQRTHGKPVAYITGWQDFWSLRLKVNEATLIPRADTEIIVEVVLQKFSTRKALSVLDLGTGSGAIALALAFEKPDWQITATDISTKALAVAKDNATRYGLANITFIQSHWYENLQNQRYDVIISNPPYIEHNDVNLCLYVKKYEPMPALISAQNGLADIKEIIKKAPLHLHPDGFMIIEHGFEQAHAVEKIYRQFCFESVQTHCDLSGHKRASSAVYPACK
ncbi:peptide chain release factor N(5)-glutamine methyltransferase [Facilibium subflavum]|uniref:peptide chain release factor N(5)-glutamine methyltransferase n=1 Tax=Facilibium subflavum TaxID=2219058 RepID=UPI000E6549EC|nr:peptide chain release factor N(5)-glutamine methyltransferase [Facilibium subflavum]